MSVCLTSGILSEFVRANVLRHGDPILHLFACILLNYAFPAIAGLNSKHFAAVPASVGVFAEMQSHHVGKEATSAHDRELGSYADQKKK
jgi:hypothetical protein